MRALDPRGPTGSSTFSPRSATCGAGQVVAAEIDPLLCETMRRSADLNGVADRIRVVEGEATTVDLPQNVDVVVAEVIETGLLDEQQAPVRKALRDRGVIGHKTRVLPDVHTTQLQLVHACERYYGFAIAVPRFPGRISDPTPGRRSVSQSTNPGRSSTATPLISPPFTPAIWSALSAVTSPGRSTAPQA